MEGVWEVRTRRGWAQKERRWRVSTAGEVPLTDMLLREPCVASNTQSYQPTAQLRLPSGRCMVQLLPLYLGGERPSKTETLSFYYTSD